MKTIAFFNNTASVGKTSLVYHLAWMLHDMGHTVLAADLDPQSNLTSIFLDESEIEKLWPEGKHADTILGAVDPLIESLGDVEKPKPIQLARRLSLIAGDLGLATFEDRRWRYWRAFQRGSGLQEAISATSGSYSRSDFREDSRVALGRKVRIAHREFSASIGFTKK